MRTLKKKQPLLVTTGWIKGIIDRVPTASPLPSGLLSESGPLSGCRNSSDTARTSPVAHNYSKNEVSKQLCQRLFKVGVSPAHPSLDAHRCHILKHHKLNFTAGREREE